MSRSFNGTSNYLEYAGAVRTALPITISAWVYKNNTTDLDVAVAITTSSTANRCGLAFTNSAKALTFCTNTSGTGGNIASTTSYSANTWNHGAAVLASTNSRSVYLNGGGSATSTVNVSSTVSAFNTTNIGTAYYNSSRQFQFGGRIAEVGIWGAALTAAEIASLAKGVSPLSIRPESLIAYWPLIGRTDPEIDLRGRYEMTVNGAVQADHPRVYMPAQPLYPRKVALAASTVPVLYRQRQMQGMAA
jgi:hypothetical protein